MCGLGGGAEAEGWAQEATAVLWDPSGEPVHERALVAALGDPGLRETEWKWTTYRGEELFCRPLFGEEGEAVASFVGNGTSAFETIDPSFAGLTEGGLLSTDYSEYEYAEYDEANYDEANSDEANSDESMNADYAEDAKNNFSENFPEVFSVDQVCSKSGGGEDAADRTALVLSVNVECGPALGTVDRELDNTALVRIESSIENGQPVDTTVEFLGMIFEDPDLP